MILWNLWLLNFWLLLNFRDVTVTLSQNVLIFVSNTSQLIGLVHFIINDWNYLAFWKKLALNQVLRFLKCFSTISLVYYKRPLGEMCDRKTENHIYLHWLGSVRTGDMMSLIVYCLCKRYYVVCSGLTSLSTIFQSYITTVSGCDRELNACFYSAASLKYHAPDTWHDTTLSHIILTLGRPVLPLPRKSECQARCSWYHFLRL